MMISNPDLVYYASASNGATILVEFNSVEADLGRIAAKCLKKTPLFHIIFSHTIRQRTYKFLIDDPFIYFAVFDENLDNSKGLAFLKGVLFIDIIESNLLLKVLATQTVLAFHPINDLDSLHFHCFQGEFNPVFHQLLMPPSNFDALYSPQRILKHSQSGSLDSPKGLKFGSVAQRGLNIKLNMEMGGEGEDSVVGNWVDIINGGAGLSREFLVLMQKKNGFYAVDSGTQRAKLVWKKHVWVVLSLDLIVCFVLFGIWLWICRGFKCIDG
ncbi:phytolongin Phyl2.2-like [Cornus florida]|uniref:phytolongin Phyl2.2-like n=1 Tax=Cornus florida TaxID=4283 RepID=UPI0028A2D375|nr:phytolongin Phyl2.2-like [Cornus florida]